MHEEVGKTNHSSHYSDVTEAGGLGRAIQAHLKAIGSRLCVKKSAQDFSGVIPFDWEVVQEKQRFSQIKIAKHQRLFMLDFWDQGVCLAHGTTPLLSKVAEVIDAWIAEETPTDELQRQFPFVGVDPRSDSHGQGATAEVDQKWEELYKQTKNDGSKGDLAPLIEKAMQVPVLRRLFPFTSLSSLFFSRCTGYPFSGDCPCACPSSRAVWQGYLTPEQRARLCPTKAYTVADSKGQFLGEGDAAEAIELIVRHLPPNCGPAIQGTADDLE
jgi:hypothetical protein